MAREILNKLFEDFVGETDNTSDVNKKTSPKSEFLKNFKWFGPGGAISAVGKGLQGYSAPFLGQAPPKEATSNTGDQFMQWMMIQEALKNKKLGKAASPVDIKAPNGLPQAGSPGMQNALPPSVRPDMTQGSKFKQWMGDNLQDKARLDKWQAVETAREKMPIEVEKGALTNKAKIQTDVEKSSLTSYQNMTLVGEIMSDYADLLVDSWEAGGAGNWMKSKMTDLAAEGVPIGDASKYKDSGAIAGKHFELVAKSFPMLTQQVSKEGSVRLIESIFSRLGASYPQGKTPPEMSPRMMKESMRTHYRINRAIATLNIDDFELKTEEGLKKFEDRVVAATNRIKLTKEEERNLEAFQNTAIERVNTHIEKLELNKEIARRKRKGLM